MPNNIPNTQTFSVRVCERTGTCAGAAIFVQIGTHKFSEMCVRVHAYITFKVQTYVRTSAPPFLAKNIFYGVFWKKRPFLAKKRFFFRKNVQVRVRAQKLGCGCMRRTL